MIRSNGVSKNPTFHTDFKNVHMTLVKSATKKSFAQKTDFLGLKSVRKEEFFDAPFDLFKEKKFSSLRRDNELF